MTFCEQHRCPSCDGAMRAELPDRPQENYVAVRFGDHRGFTDRILLDGVDVTNDAEEAYFGERGFILALVDHGDGPFGLRATHSHGYHEWGGVAVGWCPTSGLCREIRRGKVERIHSSAVLDVGVSMRAGTTV